MPIHSMAKKTVDHCKTLNTKELCEPGTTGRIKQIQADKACTSTNKLAKQVGKKTGVGKNENCYLFCRGIFGCIGYSYDSQSLICEAYKHLDCTWGVGTAKFYELKENALC